MPEFHLIIIIIRRTIIIKEKKKLFFQKKPKTLFKRVQLSGQVKVKA